MQCSTFGIAMLYSRKSSILWFRNSHTFGTCSSAINSCFSNKLFFPVRLKFFTDSAVNFQIKFCWVVDNYLQRFYLGNSEKETSQNRHSLVMNLFCSFNFSYHDIVNKCSEELINGLCTGPLCNLHPFKSNLYKSPHYFLITNEEKSFQNLYEGTNILVITWCARWEECSINTMTLPSTLLAEGKIMKTSLASQGPP